MAYDPNSILPNLGAGQPSIAGIPRYGTGPSDLGMGDPRGVTGMPVASTLGYPAMGPPTVSMTPSPVLRSHPQAVPQTPLPPVRPNFNAQPQPAAPTQPLTFWDALRNLFSGGPQAQVPGAPQGMTGMLQPRGQAGPRTDALGNPFNRFG